MLDSGRTYSEGGPRNITNRKHVRGIEESCDHVWLSAWSWSNPAGMRIAACMAGQTQENPTCFLHRHYAFEQCLTLVAFIIEAMQLGSCVRYEARGRMKDWHLPDGCSIPLRVCAGVADAFCENVRLSVCARRSSRRSKRQETGTVDQSKPPFGNGCPPPPIFKLLSIMVLHHGTCAASGLRL